jgi:hypothetical protein
MLNSVFFVDLLYTIDLHWLIFLIIKRESVLQQTSITGTRLELGRSWLNSWICYWIFINYCNKYTNLQAEIIWVAHQCYAIEVENLYCREIKRQRYSDLYIDFV